MEVVMVVRPPVIVYVPGLSETAWDTADRVAEVIARSIDNQCAGQACSTLTDSTIVIPRGLKASKSIVDGDKTVLYQLFELDYKPRMLRSVSDDSAGPPIQGLLESTKALALGLFVTLRAMGGSAKSLAARMQVGIGFLLVGALAFAWLCAVYALYTAAHLPALPGLDGVFGTNPARTSLEIAGVGTVVWATFRKRILALALLARALLNYTNNSDRNRDTVGSALDDAVGGLLDNGYLDIHVIGYSFGSLVLFDAVHPQTTSLAPTKPLDSLASMTTIGCPLDMVRLYYPHYLDDREPPGPSPVHWINIFNAADVFGSNLVDRSDTRELTAASPPQNGNATATAALAAYPVESKRYLGEDLGLFGLLTGRGLAAHSAYWGAADEGSCFGPVVEWLLAHRPEPAAGAPSNP